MRFTTKQIGKKDDHIVYEYTIQNNNGLEFSCINLGCIITKILTPDRDGNLENIVLSFETIEEYESCPHFIGATIGRNAGRIAEGKIIIDQQIIQLPCEENAHQLHSGYDGFHQRVWQSSFIEEKEQVSIVFTYTSKDGESGFPGTMEATITYTFNNENELMIEYRAIANHQTICNMTNHSYFNLSGNLKRTIENHLLELDSDQFLKLNHDLIPNGEFVNVEGTTFDFRKERKVEVGFQANDHQNEIAKSGYDHPFKLSKNKKYDVILKDPASGRQLKVITDNSYVILYTGQKLGGGYNFREAPSKDYLGLCLETQLPPYNINHEELRASTLEENQEYNKFTRYQFTTYV